MLEFTNSEALIFKNKYLVVSDLHIGYELELLRKGINVPNQTGKLIEKLQNLQDKYGTKKLIICGDLKHNIPKISVFEIKGLNRFFEKVSEIFTKVFLTKGNHDGKIEQIISSKNFKVVAELKIGKVVFTHGHRKPKTNAKLYIIGHNHPVFLITSSIGESFYEKVFVYGYTDKYEVMILPAFSNIVGGWEVGTFNGPIAKRIKSYEVFTLRGELIYRCDETLPV